MNAKKLANLVGAVGACGILTCMFLVIIAFAVATMLIGTEHHKIGNVLIASAFSGVGFSGLLWVSALAYCNHKGY